MLGCEESFEVWAWRCILSNEIMDYDCLLMKEEIDKFCRGEKAFCSSECRDKHIRSEDCKEKCRSDALKPLDYSSSPCSSPMVFLAGVAAA